MDSLTFFRDKKNAGLTKEQALKEAELYQRQYGAFTDTKPKSFQPNQILKSRPIHDIGGIYKDMLSTGKLFDMEERAKAMAFASKKYNTKNNYVLENFIAQETETEELGAIDYGKYNKIQEDALNDVGAKDNHFKTNSELYESANNDEPQSLRDRRKDDVKWYDRYEEAFWEGISGKLQSILDIKEDAFTDQFYQKVVNGEVGKKNIFGQVVKGSATLSEQYQYGSWLNWYHHNLSLAASDPNIESRARRINELRSQKAQMDNAMQDIFDVSHKGWFIKGLSEIGSGIAPLAVETGVPAGIATFLKAPKVGGLYSFIYMQQMGAGLMLDAHLSNKDVNAISSREMENINEISQVAGSAYAAVERLVSSVPFLNLGSNVDKAITAGLIKNFTKNGTAHASAKTLISYAIRTGFEVLEEGLQAQIELGTAGILEDVDLKEAKNAIVEIAKNYDKYFGEEVIAKSFGTAVESLPSVALFGLIGMPVDYISFRRDENTVEDRIKFLKNNGKYSQKEAKELAEASLIDNKEGKEARIAIATEGYVLQGVKDRKKAREFAERYENAKLSKNAKKVEIDITTELLNEIADNLSIETRVEWEEAKRLAEKLVNAKSKKEQLAVQEEIFQALRVINIEQRQIEFIEMGFSYREAYKKALQISNSFDQQRKKLQEQINDSQTTSEQITLFGLANQASNLETQKIYLDAATETTEKFKQFKKIKASPFYKGATVVFTKGDFVRIRKQYTDEQIREMFMGFPPDVYDMFIEALNSTTSEKGRMTVAQIKYNKYMMTQRDKDYKRWLNFNNLRDDRYEEKIKIDKETKQQIMNGELDFLAKQLMDELGLPNIQEARKELITQGEIEVSYQGTQRKFLRKPTRAEMSELETQAQNAINSLQQISPDTEVVFHYSKEDFKEAVGSQNRAAYKGNKIHINLELMTQEVLEGENFLAHEFGHRIFAMQLVSNPVLQAQLMDIYDLIKPDLPPEVVADLEKHIAKYKGEDYIPEEYLTQLIGVLAKNPDLLKKPKITEFVNAFKRLIGKLPMREESALDMLLNIARSINDGDILTQEDIAFLRPDLSLYTNAELEEFAKKLKLNTEGTRQELEERIYENIQFTGRNNYNNINEVEKLKAELNDLQSSLDSLSQEKGLIFDPVIEYYNEERADVIYRRKREINNRIQELIQMRASKIITESDEFKKQFEGSIVTTGLGEPKVVFHATNVLFDEFDPAMGDGGMHFGNIFQANKRMDDLYGLGDYDRIYMGYINLKNPMRMEDKGSWTEQPQVLRKQLKSMGITLQESENLKYLENLLEEYYDNMEFSSELETELLEDIKYQTTQDFIKTIKDLGYDGIIYTNEYESENKESPDDSYIIFDKEQFIPAYGVPTYGNTSTRASKINYSDIYTDLSAQYVPPRVPRVGSINEFGSKKFAPNRESVTLTKLEKQYFNSLEITEGDPHQMYADVPSFEIVDDKVRVHSGDVIALEEFITESVILDGASSVPPRLRNTWDSRFWKSLEEEKDLTRASKTDTTVNNQKIAAIETDNPAKIISYDDIKSFVNQKSHQEITRLVTQAIIDKQPVLKPSFQKLKDKTGITDPLYGQCFVGTEALYHLLGGKESKYTPTRGKDKDGYTHWWLVHKETGVILDPTADQYYNRGLEPPYDNGTGGGFPTPTTKIVNGKKVQMPSQRAEKLLLDIKQVRASKINRAEFEQFEKPEKFLIPIFRNQILDVLKGNLTPEQYVEYVRSVKKDMRYKQLPPLPSNRAIKKALNIRSREFVGKENVKPDPKTGESRTYNEGDSLEVRLDIPAFRDNGVYVVTLHLPRAKGSLMAGEAINYVATIRIKNVTFETPVAVAARIGIGGSKSTVATMKGEYVSGGTDASDVENYKLAQKLLNDPAYTQIGFNPYLASYFWTRETFEPVVSAEEVIQIGGLVFAKNIKTSNISDPRFSVIPQDEATKKRYERLINKIETDQGFNIDPDARFSKVTDEIINVLENKQDIKTSDSEGGKVRSIALKNKKLGGKSNVIDVENLDDENVNLAANRILEYIYLASQIYPNFQSWYESRLKIAMDVFGELDPDANKSENQFVLRLLMAITSNGNAVDAQTFNSWDLYQDWKKTNKLNSETVSVTGTRKRDIIKHLRMMDAFIANFGWEKMNEFLTTKGTVEELVNALVKDFEFTPKQANDIVSGELKDEVVPFSLIFGAKLGSFFNNLSGDFDTITMDRWFMRTFGRATGSQLIPQSKEIMDKRRNRVMLAIEALPQDHIIRKNLKITDKTKPTPAFIKKAAIYFAEAKNRKGEKKGSIEEEFRLSVNNLFKYGDNNKLIEAPLNGTNRRFIRLAMNKALEQYNKDTDSNFNPAELQALLWYFEKLIHSNYGSRQKDDNPDYGTSANKLYGRERGGKSAVSYQPSDAITGGRIPDGGLRLNNQEIGKPIEKIRESKVGKAVSPDFRKQIKAQIIALQKLREGEKIKQKDGEYEEHEGRTAYDVTKKSVERARQLILGNVYSPEERKTTEENINQALKKYDEKGRKILIANLVHSPRVLSAVEVHALAIHKTVLEEKLEDIQSQVSDLANSNDQMLLDGLQDRYTAILREYDTTLAVISATSSSWGATGVALRVTKRKPMYSSANILAQAEIAKGDKLTNEERKELADLGYQIDVADRELMELEKEILKISEKTQEEEASDFLKATLEGKKRELDEILDERRQILIEVAELGYYIPEIHGAKASKDEINSAKLAHQVYKLSRNFIEGGAKTLEEVVNAVQGILPFVDRNTIIKIMAERSPKSTKRNKSIATKLTKDLEKAKRVLDKIENLKNGIFNPKRKLTPDDPEVKNLRNELKILQRLTVNTEADDAKADKIFDLIEQIIDGVVIVSTENLPPQAKSEKLKIAEQQLREVRRLKRVEAKIVEMKRILREGDYESLPVPPPRTEVTNQKLKDATIELAKLKAEVSNRIYALRDKTAFDKFSEVMGLPRAILASTDMSYALRQGLIVSAGHPILASKAFAGAFKAAFSLKNYRLIDDGIKNNANHALRVHYGLYFSSIDASLDQREEMFATNLLDKIADFPAIKYSGAGLIIKGLKGFSERNMVTGLNLLRAGLFDKFKEDNRNATDAELEAYARYINVATGRGDLGALTGGAQALSQVFFSPRFTASRIQAPLMALNNLRRSPALRNEMLRQWVSLFGVAMTVMALARLAGGETEDDPESGMFGKIKFGNVTIDIFGGLLQPFRVLAITLKAGHVNWIQGDDRFIDVQGVASRFVKYKLSPPFSIGYELLTGKDWIRSSIEATPLETVEEALVPLFIQTIKEIHEKDVSGLEASILASEFFGTSTMYYD